MQSKTGNTFSWYKNKEDGYDICDNEGPYACYYPDTNRLVVSEEGKCFSDHAVATFQVKSREHAEEIIEALRDLKTV